MKLMVTGADGQIGWELGRSLAGLGNVVVSLNRQQCDLWRSDRVHDVIRHVKPDVIVNAAAYTSADDAQHEELRATKVNAIAAGALAREAAAASALLVHYSCNSVFDGCKDGPYTEDDTPHPVSALGRSKLAGEHAVRQAGGRHLILRTGWVYSTRGRNILRKILRLLRERDELRIVADQIGRPATVTDAADLRTFMAQLREREELPVAADQAGAPTSAADIAEATASLIEAAARESTDGRFASGLYHVTASGSTSWHGFAKAALEGATRYGLVARGDAPRLVPVVSEDYWPQRAAVPRNAQLSGDRLRERYGITLPHWKDGLAMCFEEEVGAPEMA
jgi:dTDP-4-dehydrorhamnose reductase